MRRVALIVAAVVLVLAVVVVLLAAPALRLGLDLAGLEDLRYRELRLGVAETELVDVPFFYDLSVAETPCFVGNGILLHNTHGHALTTGAIKNSFGGLLKEVRHYAHEFIHEVMVDLTEPRLGIVDQARSAKSQ
jgi:hypothetical protein